MSAQNMPASPNRRDHAGRTAVEVWGDEWPGAREIITRLQHAYDVTIRKYARKDLPKRHYSAVTAVHRGCQAEEPVVAMALLKDGIARGRKARGVRPILDVAKTILAEMERWTKAQAVKRPSDGQVVVMRPPDHEGVYDDFLTLLRARHEGHITFDQLEPVLAGFRASPKEAVTLSLQRPDNPTAPPYLSNRLLDVLREYVEHAIRKMPTHPQRESELFARLRAAGIQAGLKTLHPFLDVEGGVLGEPAPHVGDPSLISPQAVYAWRHALSAAWEGVHKALELHIQRREARLAGNVRPIGTSTHRHVSRNGR